MLEEEAYRGTGITQIFFQIMHKTMLFFRKQRDFFKVCFKKKRKTQNNLQLYMYCQCNMISSLPWITHLLW